MEPIFFATSAELRAWFAAHADHEAELYVGLYKKATGLPSATWSEAVDEALCVGWIDGIGRRIDETSHMIRFTPRRKGSIWSLVNVRKVEALTAEGRMRPAGIAAYEARTEEKTAVYSHERAADAELEPEQESRFRASESAWKFFQAQPPSYRRAALHWIVSAKRPETRERRLATLIADSAAGRRPKQFAR